jgi:hypothetical protein
MKRKQHYTKQAKFSFNASEMNHIRQALATQLNHIHYFNVSDREHGEAEKAAWAADVSMLREKVDRLFTETWG